MHGAVEPVGFAPTAARIVLNSGREQPEALALYEELGYRPVPGYGVYACAPGAIFLGKALTEGEEKEPSWAS